MSNEKETNYIGSGKQLSPERIEAVIFIDNLAPNIRTSKAGKNYIVVDIWKRKSTGSYGETHNVKLKEVKPNENI